MYSETPSEKSKKGKVLARPIKIIQFVFAIYLLYINGLNHFIIIGINFTIFYESKKNRVELSSISQKTMAYNRHQ